MIRTVTALLCLLFWGALPIAISAQSGQSCGFVTAGKLNVYYCEQGKGPAVILLHAGFLDRHQWDSQVTALSKKYRVITPDLPGHGLTKGIDTSFTIAKVINRFLDVLHIKTVSVVGISLGATSALDFALTYPARVNKLILCSPGLTGWQEVMAMDTVSRKYFLRSDTNINTSDPGLVTENFLGFWLDGPFRKTAPVDTATRGYIYRTALDKLVHPRGSLPVFDKRKAAKRVEQLHKPVLILCGDLDVPFIRQVSNYLHARIKGSKLVTVENAAHLFPLEKPAEFNNYLTSWLK